MEPRTLDHVAFWVTEREQIAAFCERHLGMHLITQESNFSLMGSDARRGKLTLFDAEGPREPGVFKHVGLRVSDLAAARESLPAGTPDVFEIGGGIFVTLVEAPTDVDYDLDHVALWSSSPEETADAYRRYGFSQVDPTRVEVGGAYVEFHPGDPGEPDKPLLNHVAVLVDEVDPVIAEAQKREIVDNVVDAANTRAVFVWGPERVRIEYVEHKPGFALQ